jgi:hypothetical protein
VREIVTVLTTSNLQAGNRDVASNWASAMTMAAPFVGRTRELRRLRGLLESGRNIVVTGPFGSGRTSLVRRLEVQLRGQYRFLFVCPSDTRRAVRRTVAGDVLSVRTPSRHASLSTKPARVVVFDDVMRVTAQRARFIRELLSDDDRVRIMLIAEHALAGDELVRVRGILNAAPVVHVGPLSSRDVEEYIIAHASAAGMSWPLASVREMARSTHGYALGMQLAVEAALRHSTAATSASSGARRK